MPIGVPTALPDSCAVSRQIRSWRVDRGIAFGNRRFPCRFRLLRLKPMSFSKAHSRHRKLLGGLLLLASVIGFGVALCLGCGPVSRSSGNRYVLIEHVTLIDSTGAPAKDNVSVLLEG